MKTFTLETSKREDLQEYLKDKDVKGRVIGKEKLGTYSVKSLNTEEAIEYLPREFHGDELHLFPNQHGYGVAYLREASNDDDCKLNNYIFLQSGNTLIEALEKMYIYLLDNKLI